MHLTKPAASPRDHRIICNKVRLMARLDSLRGHGCIQLRCAVNPSAIITAIGGAKKPRSETAGQLSKSVSNVLLRSAGSSRPFCLAVCSRMGRCGEVLTGQTRFASMLERYLSISGGLRGSGIRTRRPFHAVHSRRRGRCVLPRFGGAKHCRVSTHDGAPLCISAHSLHALVPSTCRSFPTDLCTTAHAVLTTMTLTAAASLISSDDALLELLQQATRSS